MISKVDILNLNATKPGVNTKGEMASISEGTGFSNALAGFQQENAAIIGENISLLAEKLPEMNIPNQVSEDSLKTFTENLNSFSGLKTVMPEFLESMPDMQELQEAPATLPEIQPQVVDPELAMAALMFSKPLNVQAPVPEKTTEVSEKTFTKSPSVFPTESQVSTVPVQAPQAFTAPVENKQTAVSEKASTPKQDQILNVDKPLQTGEMPASVVQTVVAQNPQASLSPVSEKAKSSLKQVAENKKGKLSLDGMELVKPEVFAGFMPEIPKAEQAAQSIVPEAVVANNKSMPFMAPVNTEEKSLGAGFKDSKDVSIKDSGKSVDTPAEQGFMQIANKGKQADLKVVAAPVTAPISETDRKESVDQIITHARTILNKGGGEMKLKLNSDGLGMVDLKVGVQNGQVSIEINTQNDRVKKMFEEGINDIRGALEVHNLKMDVLKVNVAGNHLENQMDRQMGQQFMNDRDFARQFLGNFRDERQGFRQQSMTDAFSKFQRSGNNDQPSGLRPSAYNRSGGSSRLNVVA